MDALPTIEYQSGKSHGKFADQDQHSNHSMLCSLITWNEHQSLAKSARAFQRHSKVVPFYYHLSKLCK